MSTQEDVTQEETLPEAEALEQEATPELDEQTDEAVAAEPEQVEAEAEEYEVIERDIDPSDDKRKQNKAFAKMRIEEREAKKRAKQLEDQLKRVESGDIPDELKERLQVAPNMPAQPDINEFLSDDGLAKYDYDRDRAIAAFNQKNTAWLLEAQNARTTSQHDELKVRQQYLESERRKVQTLNAFGKAADEMNIKGFDEAEQELNKVSQNPGASTYIAELFGDDTKEAVAVVNYLGRNPQEVQRILAMEAGRANSEILKLGYKRLKLQKKTASARKEADSGLSGGSTTSADGWKRELSALLDSGDNSAFRKAKKAAEVKLGRAISYSELN